MTLRLPEYRTHAGTLATEWETSRDREWQTLEAGTFMHELGHNLALEHGGDQSRPNYKPNYLSVMNYNYQWNSSGNAVHIPGASRETEVRTNRPLDFSRDDHVTLQESNLPEQDALGDLPADWRIRYGPNVDTSSNGGGRVAPALGDDGDVDWNGDRSLTNGVSVDLNGNGSARDDLGSYDDWDNITYNFRTSPDFSFGSHQTARDHGPEQNATDYINGGLGSTDEDGDGIPNAEDDAPLEPGSNSSTPSSPATSSPGWVGIGAILGVVVIMLVLYVVRRRHQS